MRIDESLVSAAKAEFRTVQGQVEFWAKVGRAALDNPDIGERKKGDLAELWVHTFRNQGQLYLLGYTREDAVRLVYLEALGPHENLYRDLKQ